MRGRPRLRDWLLAGVIGWGLAAAAGHESFYGETDSPAEREQRRLAAVAQCRDAYGWDALVRYTPDGDLVCRRNHRAP